MERFGRTREVAVFRNGQKVTDVTEQHRRPQLLELPIDRIINGSWTLRIDSSILLPTDLGPAYKRSESCTTSSKASSSFAATCCHSAPRFLRSLRRASTQVHCSYRVRTAGSFQNLLPSVSRATCSSSVTQAISCRRTDRNRAA